MFARDLLFLAAKKFKNLFKKKKKKRFKKKSLFIERVNDGEEREEERWRI